jgi:hypothetical protein
MDRDLELRIKGHLYEITTVNDEVIDGRRGFPAAKRGYRKTLASVANCAGAEMVDRVGDSIKEAIRDEGERPNNQTVRRDARMLLVNAEIVPDEYLSRA